MMRERGKLGERKRKGKRMKTVFVDLLPIWPSRPVLDEMKTISFFLISHVGAGVHALEPSSTAFPGPLAGCCIRSGATMGLL